MTSKAQTQKRYQNQTFYKFAVSFIAMIIMMTFFGSEKKVNAASGDEITRIDLETDSPLPETFDECSPVEQPNIYIKNVQSKYGTVKKSDLEIVEGEYYGWCQSDGSDWYPYAEDGVQYLYFCSGESRFMVEINVSEPGSGIAFSDDCDIVINGITMNLYKEYGADDKVFYFSLTAVHVSEKDVVKEVDLELKRKPAAGMPYWTCRPSFEVTDIKLKSGKKVDRGIFDDLDAKWCYKSGETYKPYLGSADKFKEDEHQLELILSINPRLSAGYVLDSNLVVNLDYNEMSILDNTLGNQKIKLGKIVNIYKPEVYIYASDITGLSDSKVSFDGIKYDSSVYDFITYDKTVKLFAKPDENSEFVEWRKGSQNGEVIGKDPTIEVIIDGNEDYYAIFQKKMVTEGILSDSVKYSFEKSTGTLTLIPTEPEGDEYVGWADTSNYTSSPFYKNMSVKRVIVKEGIKSIGDYVFNSNTLEYVSLPKSLTYISSRAFESCKFYGEGFEVADENEKYKDINGSLASKDGKTLIKYFQKTGENTYAIPDGVTTLGRFCFENCELDKLILKNEGLALNDYAINCIVKHMVIEEGVENLGWGSDFTCDDKTMYIPASVKSVGFSNNFLDSSKLVNIVVSEDSEYYTSIAGVLYEKTDEGLLLVKFPSGKTASSYVTPQNVIGLKIYAIQNNNLKSISLTDKVSSLEEDSISYLTNVKVTVENPDCEFLSGIYDDAIEKCTNLTICGAIGSTAQVFAEKKGYAFEAIGTDNGKLSTPKNLKWDGCVAKWDKVENATKYIITLYKDETGDGTYGEFKSFNLDAEETSYNFSTWMWYKDYKYKYTIKASAPYYEISDVAESLPTIGRFSKGKIQGLSITGDTLNFTPYLDDEGDDCSYYLYVYDESDSYVNDFYYNIDQNNLRSYFNNYSITTYGKYKIRVRAFVSSSKTDGYLVDVAETDTPVIYDFKEITPIDKIYVRIPDPVAKENPMLDDLKIETYCGEDQLDGIKASTSFWGNSYMYKETEESSWKNFDSSEGILNGKYAYSYNLTLDSLAGYTIKDSVEVFVNGEKTNVTIYDKTSNYVSIRYEFPIGTKAFYQIKTATVTGDYTEPVIGEDIKDPENVQVAETGVLVNDAYWITKEGSEWKNKKISGKFEAGKEYAIYVSLRVDEENDYCLKLPGLDSYSIFGDNEAICNYYNFTGADFIKVVGKLEAAPSPTPLVTPGADVTPTPAPTDPSVSPTPATSPTPSATPEVTATPAPVGTTLTDTKGKAKYKVISVGKTDPADPTKDELPAVAYTGTTNKKAKKISVLDTVTINDVTYMVESVGANALKNNKKITSVTIGKNVKVIEKNAFANCPKLKTVNCKSKVLYKIGANAFKSDNKLTKMTLKTTLLKKSNVGKNAIKGTSKKLKISVPKKVKKSYQKIFRAKGNKKVKTK